MIPKDPAILLSFVNMKLRDCYNSLEDLCADLDVDSTAITAALSSLGYHYDAGRNQFTA